MRFALAIVFLFSVSAAFAQETKFALGGGLTIFINVVIKNITAEYRNIVVELVLSIEWNCRLNETSSE